MAFSFSPAPTWRQCHPVNIYVFRNGVPAEKPQLVHIPIEMKKSMLTVLEAIALRMKLPVGYPIALYDMNGRKICKTYNLEMYSYYVVVTNIEKRFKCIEYGQVKEPLVVIGHHSKHLKTLNFQQKRYDLFCRQKVRKRLHELIPHGEQNGLGPTEILAQGPPCGTLCTRIPPQRDQYGSCCTDDVVRVTPEMRGVSDGGYCDDKEIQDLARQVRSKNQCGQLAELIQRYEHVGSDIFKMFNTRINETTEDYCGKEMMLDKGSKWDIPEEYSPSIVKMNEELNQIANASCQFAFDNRGNFIGSRDECRSYRSLNAVGSAALPDLPTPSVFPSKMQVQTASQTMQPTTERKEVSMPSSKRNSNRSIVLPELPTSANEMSKFPRERDPSNPNVSSNSNMSRPNAPGSSYYRSALEYEDDE